MKKSKKFAAIVLCIAMLLGMSSICAGAINVGDTITHEFTLDDGEIRTAEYTYEGTFDVGENLIEERYDDQAFVFTVEQSGFYFVDSINCACTVSKEYSNGVAKEFSRYEWYFDSDGNFGELHYLEEGEVAFFIFAVGDTSHVELNIDYCGEVFEVNFTNKVDFYINEYDVSVYNGNKIDVDFIEYEVLFTSGETYKNDKETVDTLILNEELKDGENTLTLNILDRYEEEFIFNIYPIDRFVESIEIENVEEYCVMTVFYNELFDSKSLGETPVDVTVEYTDGSEETISYYINSHEDIFNAYITLPNGNEYYIYDTINEEDGVYYFEAGIADKTYVKEECEVIEADFATNSDYLSEIISEYLSDLKYNIEFILHSIPDADNFESLMYHVESMFRIPAFFLSIIFDEIILFLANAF